jgi:hypothetical protein
LEQKQKEKRRMQKDDMKCEEWKTKIETKTKMEMEMNELFQQTELKCQKEEE